MAEAIFSLKSLILKKHNIKHITRKKITNKIVT